MVKKREAFHRFLNKKEVLSAYFFNKCTHFSTQVIMNNFMMTNIEVDSINFSMNDFKITLFKNYFGKVYSALVLKSNLSGT